MVVPPKEISDTKFGGYLLNDENYVEGAFTKSKLYRDESTIEEDNKIYYLISNVKFLLKLTNNYCHLSLVIKVSIY